MSDLVNFNYKSESKDLNVVARELLEKMGINANFVSETKGTNFIEVQILDSDKSLEEGFRKLTGGDCNERTLCSNDL